MIIEQVLLEPKFREAGSITYRHKTADIVRSDAAAMNLISVGIEAEPFPQARFVQIAKHISPKHAVVGLALMDSPGVSPR